MKQVSAAEKKDMREVILQAIIKELESGAIPWRQGWKKVAGGPARGSSFLPYNMITRKKYHGINRLILMMAMNRNNWTDNRFLTFKQAGQIGARVKAGQKGTKVFLWDRMMFWERKDVTVLLYGNPLEDPIQETSAAAVMTQGGSYWPKDAFTVVLKPKNNDDIKTYSFEEAEKKLNIVYTKTFTVFNAQQCDGIAKEEAANTTLSTEQLNETLDFLVEGMRQTGLRLEFDWNEQPLYNKGIDCIFMPMKEQFESDSDFNSTLLHEIMHATGHERRLNRKFGQYGTEEYAREELVAEIASVFVGAETGLECDNKNAAAYIKSWITILNNDKNAIFQAAKEAENASSYVIEKTMEGSKKIPMAA